MLLIIRTFNIILLLSTLHTQYSIKDRSLCEKVFMIYILILFLHNFYIIPLHLFWPQHALFLDYAAPWGIMHGPLLYFTFKCVIDQKLSKKTIIRHSIPVGILWISYFFIVNSLFINRLNVLQPIYFNILYFSFMMSWFAYSLYILIKSYLLKENKMLLNGLAIFYSLLTFFMLTTIVIAKQPLYIPPKEIPNVFVALFMSINSILAFAMSQQHLNGLYRKKTASITKEKPTVKKTKNIEFENKKEKTILTSLQKKEITLFFKSHAICNVNLSLKDAANQLDITQKDLTKYIKTTYGLTFVKHLTQARVKLACKLLEKENFDINNENLAVHCGFGSSATFYRNFKEITGFSPKAYYNNIRQNQEQ